VTRLFALHFTLNVERELDSTVAEPYWRAVRFKVRKESVIQETAGHARRLRRIGIGPAIL